MTSKAIQTVNKPTVYTDDQITLIKNTVAKGATVDEFKLFLLIAARSGLDVFSKQIHFVKRAGQGTIQTGIDGFRAIAVRSGELAGIDDAVYDTEADTHPNKATVTVYRLVGGLKTPFTASARWVEYVPAPGQDFMWQKMPYLMLGKVAEALALRKAFPNDLSGLYTHDEMAQATDTPPASDNKVYTPQRVCQIHGTPAIDGQYGTYCRMKDAETGKWCKGPFGITEPAADEIPFADNDLPVIDATSHEE